MNFESSLKEGFGDILTDQINCSKIATEQAKPAPTILTSPRGINSMFMQQQILLFLCFPSSLISFLIFVAVEV